LIYSARDNYLRGDLPMKMLMALTLFTTLTGAVSAAQVPVLSCFGTEPFWNVSTDAKGVLTYSNLGEEQERVYTKTTLLNQPNTHGYAFQITAEDEASNKLDLYFVKTECNDGMSDEVYPYDAAVVVDGVTLRGCCK
jgi:uncharacterized membrane protein